jgi:hypothetical protein
MKTQAGDAIPDRRGALATRCVHSFKCKQDQLR